MFRQLILYNILFIPSIVGVSSRDSVPITSSSKDFYNVDGGKLLNLTGISEGGPIIQTTPPIALPKENHTALLSLDNELSKDKSVGPTNSKVVPRKGVVFEDNSTSVHSVSELHKNTNLTVHDEKKNISNSETKITTKNDTKKLDLGTNTTSVKTNETLPKKPLILSAEALAKIPVVPQEQLLFEAAPSSAKTAVVDQMPSPRLQIGASRHPGMVMPIVITILVVPMFAVLGYMALKRGKEAWKNRHYKRMDFLLDGMYND